VCHPPNSCCFEENGLFQHPQAFTLKTPVAGSMSAMGIFANHGEFGSRLAIISVLHAITRRSFAADERATVTEREYRAK
jgi:hypothetical protein